MAWLCKSNSANATSDSIMRSNDNNWHYVLLGEPRVVDGISCREMYLRRYKFSRKERVVHEKTQKCFERVMEKVASKSHGGRKNSSSRRKCSVLEKVKEISCSSLIKVFHRLLSCVIVLDVEE